MRCFLGSKLDESLVDDVSQVKDDFKAINADIKFVKDENLHFTVKFLGEIGKSKVEKVDKVEGRLEDYDPFQFELKGAGVFPSKGYIRVIWIGVGEGYEKFRGMLEDIDGVLSEEGFEEENKDIVPHMTIGRVKSGRNKGRIVSRVEELEGKVIGRMRLNEVTLFKSDLTPQGPVYKRLKNYRL